VKPAMARSAMPRIRNRVRVKDPIVKARTRNRTPVRAKIPARSLAFTPMMIIAVSLWCCGTMETYALREGQD